MPVDVTQAGSVWAVKAVSTADLGFSMTLTTSGTATGVARGELTGSLFEVATNTTIITTNIGLDGRNSGTNLAGGDLAGAITFRSTGGAFNCTTGNWTLTPR